MSGPPQGSGIRAVFDRARQLEAAGRSIVHLEIGRPHLGSPRCAVDAATAALDGGDVHYTENRGRLSLREAIAASTGEPARDPDRELIVTAGGSEAVLCALHAACGPGDEVLLLTPTWPHYRQLVGMTGARPVELPCAEADGFEPDPGRVAAAIGQRTRALVVCSPSNPTGAVFGRDTLERLAGLAIENDLTVISDEIYRRFTSGAGEHVSIASLPGMAERTLVADSFSKTYAMTGWRVGWLAGPAALIDRAAVIHQHVAVCAPSFAQAGAEAAISGGEPFVSAMVAEYDERRRRAAAALTAIGGVTIGGGQGALYLFPRVEGAGPDLATRLLEDEGVACVPGGVFGDDFPDHLRISVAVSERELEEGIGRLVRGLGRR